MEYKHLKKSYLLHQHQKTSLAAARGIPRTFSGTSTYIFLTKWVGCPYLLQKHKQFDEGNAKFGSLPMELSSDVHQYPPQP